MNDIAQNSNEYIDVFEQNEAALNEYSTTGMNAHRRKAIDRFKEVGFPTRKKEDYKYTDLNAVFGYDYGVDIKNISAQLSLETNCSALLKDAYNLTMRNGHLVQDENISYLSNAGIIACSLQEASIKHKKIFDKYYNQQATDSTHSVVDLNTAFVADGLFIYVPKNIILDNPIQITGLLHSMDDLLINTRNLFIVDKNAKVQILDYAHSLGYHSFLSNSVTELYAEANSSAEYYCLQNQHEKTTIVTNLFISQKRDSKVLSNLLSINAKLIRNNVNVCLMEENCENSTYGLYFGTGNEHIDNFTSINHIAPHCKSWEHFKGILDDKSTSAFCGRIHVCKDAQKTEAYQTNNNILLSDISCVKTKPQLIIEADDVSCSHGATVGQLDEEGIFYLRSRGISYKEAYKVMMGAFMDEIVSKIEINKLQEHINIWIRDKMEGKITFCQLPKSDFKMI